MGTRTRPKEPDPKLRIQRMLKEIMAEFECEFSDALVEEIAKRMADYVLYRQYRIHGRRTKKLREKEEELLDL